MLWLLFFFFSFSSFFFVHQLDLPDLPDLPDLLFFAATFAQAFALTAAGLFMPLRSVCYDYYGFLFTMTVPEPNNDTNRWPQAYKAELTAMSTRRTSAMK